MKIYKLKKDVNSPNFTRTIEAGRIYTPSQLQSSFDMNERSLNFNEWFEDVSEQYEIKGCNILKKDTDEIVRSRAFLLQTH